MKNILRYQRNISGDLNGAGGFNEPHLYGAYKTEGIEALPRGKRYLLRGKSTLCRPPGSARRAPAVAPAACPTADPKPPLLRGGEGGGGLRSADSQWGSTFRGRSRGGQTVRRRLKVEKPNPNHPESRGGGGPTPCQIQAGLQTAVPVLERSQPAIGGKGGQRIPACLSEKGGEGRFQANRSPTSRGERASSDPTAGREATALWEVNDGPGGGGARW